MADTEREETRMLIARQIAIFNGTKPTALMISGSLRNTYMTLAESIIATVERRQRRDQHHD